MLMNRRAALAGGALGGAFVSTGAVAASARPSDTIGQVDIWRAEFGSVRDRAGEDTVNGPVDMGQIVTAADPARPERGTCRLRFARLKGRGDKGAAPVVFFNGGPWHGEDLWWLTDGGFGHRNTFGFISAILDHADLILIDHRGTAGCPRPSIPNNRLQTKLPLDAPAPEALRREAARALWSKMLAYQSEFGVDLSTITTPNLVSDADQIREALGYPKVRLIGLSNGTYRAREYLRQHGDHVEDALLFVSHAYEKQPHPADVRDAVRRFDEAVQANPAASKTTPPTLEALPEVAHRLDRTHPRVAIPKQPDGTEAIVLSGEDITLYFWACFTGSREIARWPQRMARLAAGDYSELAQLAPLGRILGTENGSDLAYAGTAMPTPEVRRTYRAAAGDAAFLDRALSEVMADECPLPRDRKTPFEHRSPVTYIQGEWDTHTPIDAVRRLAEPTATLVVNGRQGHESTVSSGSGGKLFGFETPVTHAFLTSAKVVSYTQPVAFEGG